MLTPSGLKRLAPPEVSAGSCSVSAFSTHTAAIRLPCGVLLFSTPLRCAHCLLWGNERSVTFPASMRITPYSETQSTCVKDHCAWGGGLQSRVKLSYCSATLQDVALFCVWQKGLCACLKWKRAGNKHVMLEMLLINVNDFLFELGLMSSPLGVVLDLSHRPHLHAPT